MSVGEAGGRVAVSALFGSVFAILLGALAMLVDKVFAATRIDGNGQLAQAQESLYGSAKLGLDLYQLASSIEFIMLVILLILAVVGALSAKSGR